MTYGPVKVRTWNGNTETVHDAELLEFITIPVEKRVGEGDGYRVLVFGVVETTNGDFFARQLSEIKRRSVAAD